MRFTTAFDNVKPGCQCLARRPRSSRRSVDKPRGEITSSSPHTKIDKTTTLHSCIRTWVMHASRSWVKRTTWSRHFLRDWTTFCSGRGVFMYMHAVPVRQLTSHPFNAEDGAICRVFAASKVTVHKDEPGAGRSSSCVCCAKADVPWVEMGIPGVTGLT